MRPQTHRRSRHRSASPQGSSNPQRRNSSVPLRHQSFDSNGPDGLRVRGTVFQIAEKYQALARDAASSGDRVVEQSYLQYAEHYQRLMAAVLEAEQLQYQERARNYADGNQEGQPQQSMGQTQAAPMGEAQIHRPQRQVSVMEDPIFQPEGDMDDASRMAG